MDFNPISKILKKMLGQEKLGPDTFGMFKNQAKHAKDMGIQADKNIWNKAYNQERNSKSFFDEIMDKAGEPPKSKESFQGASRKIPEWDPSEARKAFEDEMRKGAKRTSEKNRAFQDDMFNTTKKMNKDLDPDEKRKKLLLAIGLSAAGASGYGVSKLFED